MRFAGSSLSKPKRFNFAAAAAGYRGIFADPRAKVCFSSVFFEGITIHGMFPFVALLLLASGETRSSYAGMVIAAFGLGGILFSLSLPVLVAHITERRMMLIGAVCASIAFVLIAISMPWYKLAAVFLLFGIGFYMLHNCIQVHVTDLSQTARASAMSMHSCFFFFGQAIGPIYYGYAFHHFGNSAPPLLGAAVILVIGLICARFLRHRRKMRPCGSSVEGPIFLYRPGVPRGCAAEITPVEPVWVMPAKGAALSASDSTVPAIASPLIGKRPRVAIIGAGIVGLGIAWRLTGRAEVSLFDRGKAGMGSSHAAAGMLAACCEAEPGEEVLLALGRDSQARWPGFADELSAGERR